MNIEALKAIDHILGVKAVDEATPMDTVVDGLLGDSKIDEGAGPLLTYNFQAFQNAIRGALMGADGSNVDVHQQNTRHNQWDMASSSDFERAKKIISDILPKPACLPPED